MKLLCVLLVLLGAGAANAATIDKVMAGGGTVVLTLSDEEKEDLKPGDQITISVRSPGKPGAGITGKILDVKGHKARVAVSAKKGALKAGRDVTVAASDLGGMSVAPQAASGDGAALPPTAAEHETSPGFQTGLFHPSVVSPAQIYQTTGMRTDVKTEVASDNYTLDASGNTDKATFTGQAVEALLSYDIQKWGIRVGLDATHVESAGSVTFAFQQTSIVNGQRTSRTQESTVKVRSVETNLAPLVAVPVGRTGLYAAVSYQVEQRHDSSDFEAASHNFTYAVTQPALLYANATLEAGLAFTPEVHQISTVSDGAGGSSTSPIHDPAKTTLHARAKAGSGADVFAVIVQNQNRMLNIDDTHGWKNNADMMAGGDLSVAPDTVVTAALVGNTPAYDSPANNAPDRMVRYGALGGVERRYSDKMRFAAEASYEYGRASYIGDQTIKDDTYAFQVSGTVRL